MKNLLFLIGLIFISFQTFASNPELTKTDTLEVADSEKLVVLWTSGDAEVAKKMVYMYTYNAKKYGWWKDITFIIWGPSSKLLSEDTELQDYLKLMKEEGIVLEACKACADMYNVSDKLTELGVDVKYMGTVLTDYIKGEHHVITF
ncbi:DsrE family protein [Bacteroidota bacterium]